MQAILNLVLIRRRRRPYANIDTDADAKLTCVGEGWWRDLSSCGLVGQRIRWMDPLVLSWPKRGSGLVLAVVSDSPWWWWLVMMKMLLVRWLWSLGTVHLGDSEDFGTDLTILVRILRFWKGSNGFGSIWSWAFPPKPDAPTTTTDDRHHAPTTNQPWQWQSGNDNGDVLIDFSSTTYCSPKYITQWRWRQWILITRSWSKGESPLRPMPTGPSPMLPSIVRKVSCRWRHRHGCCDDWALIFAVAYIYLRPKSFLSYSFSVK